MTKYSPLSIVALTFKRTLSASNSIFLNKLLFVLGGGTGGVFFLGGLVGPPAEELTGLGVLGGVGAGLLLGVNTNAAGTLTVLSDFSKSLGEDASAAVITLGSSS